MVPVAIPMDMWAEDMEGVISAWLFEDGDRIKEGDLIAEVMVEKTSYDLTAPASGVLRIEIAQDMSFRRGARVARIE